MDWANSFDQFLNQISEGQRQIFKSLTSAIPGGQIFNTQNMREGFDNVLNFQEQVVTSSIEAQALIMRLAIESQRQLWQNYFNLLRK
jgi:hypothetical protein